MSRLLIVEDDQAIAELERDYLEAEGFEVAIEATGNGGLERARAKVVDLVVLDVMLPGTNGFEICRTLRAETETPILMVSARGADVDKIRGLGLGTDDYLTKPFSPAELVARVKAHLSRYRRLAGPSGKTSTIISVAGLTLDRSSMRVTVDDREISLTAREFAILELLAANPDRVFSREKLEADPSEPRIIETVWGVGYRLRP